MKRGKRVAPKFPLEYRILIAPVHHERQHERLTLIAMRTVNEFSTFRYDIVVEPELKDHTLTLNIRGLRAPQVSLPGSGPAVFRTEIENLSGRYEIVVCKLDRQVNAFTVLISEDSITVEKSPKDKFVEIVTDHAEW